jgi:hypothetical protein
MAQSSPRRFSLEFWAKEKAFWAAVPCSNCGKPNCPYYNSKTMRFLEDMRVELNCGPVDATFLVHVHTLQARAEEKLANEIAELAAADSLDGKNQCLKWAAEDVAFGKVILARAQHIEAAKK